MNKQNEMTIQGTIEFPDQWTVIGPFKGANVAVSAETLISVPSKLSIAGETKPANPINPTRNQYDFIPLYGDPPYKKPLTTFIFVPLFSETEQDVTFGIGADWYYRLWVNGEVVLDLMEEGNGKARPAINNHLVTTRLQPGDNVAVVQLVNGKGGPILAFGGPSELREGDFKSILPPRDSELDASQLLERYPTDPAAAIHWEIPEGFDPRKPDLGLRPMPEADHVELLHSLRSEIAADEGGSGIYESLQHGSWNHNMSVCVYKDRLLAIWHNHERDENGPGSRTIARVGKVINDRGDIDWGGKDSFVELAPQAVPVRRRRLVSDSDAVRDAQAAGNFTEIDGRLIFRGYLQALHGVTTRLPRNVPHGEVLTPDAYAHSKTAQMPDGTFAVWDLGFRFYQEWGVRDDRFQPLSPLFRENDLAESLQMTTKLNLPLEPLIPPYSNAPLLADAPQEMQELVQRANAAAEVTAQPVYRPGTQDMTEDGTNGLVHGAYFTRPDGSQVAIRENQKPSVQPFYYTAEKKKAEAFFPPAVRSNLYGAADPTAGELPDGTPYIIGNSPNRQTIYITISEDGRTFDRSWFLLHRRVSDYTPGAMKSQGGPGAGPQYVRPAVIGNSLWLIYSISKEHVGATRVPLEALS